MLNFLKPVGLLIIKWVAIIGGVLIILFKARQSGKKAEQEKSMLETLRGLKTRDKVENDVINANDDKLSKLRDKWTKK